MKSGSDFSWGIKNRATAHGFRSLFCSIANEAGWGSNVIERQMANKERNKVRAAYHHEYDLVLWH
jgi:integrase